MYKYIVLIITASCAAAPPPYPKPKLPQPDYKTATILQQDYTNEGAGNYNFAYHTSDGMSREEKAELKNVGSENEALVVQGSFTYVGVDGVTYTVNYVADENGYRPSAEHIPRLQN
ncbi:hypothetical protein Trydic_g22296 [Trypoxylus dichotomus]